SLTLMGTNGVPEDCSLLIVPGPTDSIPEAALEKIDDYLRRNGRLFALFNAQTANRPTGLEKVLARWGALVGGDIVVDPDQLDMKSKQNIAVSGFALHPAVNPVLGSGLYMFLPRPVNALESMNTARQKLKTEVIAATGTNAFLLSSEGKQRKQLPVLVAVERAEPVAALSEDGVPSRMLICGDSFLLCNKLIDLLGNRTFADCAVNWLLDRSVLLDIGPRPVNEYRLVIAPAQMKSLQWILLGGIPAGILLFGGVVWLTRRR
ncbi:MAG TPA: hypothetical protein PKH32_06115, partial [Verrucomicrobiota bacterium]|nr:hypothetical protein [Verrucomicrobiota bacterium]